MNWRVSAASVAALAIVILSFTLIERTQAERAISGALIPTFHIEGFGPEHMLAQSFVAPANRLSAVELGIASGSPTASLDLRLRYESGAEILSERIPVSASAEPQRIVMRFPPVVDSRGQPFVLEVRRPSDAPEVPLDGVGTDAFRDGQFIDPLQDVFTTRQIDMAIRLFQQTTLGNALADAIRYDKKAVLIAGLLGSTVFIGLALAVRLALRATPARSVFASVAILALVAFVTTRTLLGFG